MTPLSPSALSMTYRCYTYRVFPWASHQGNSLTSCFLRVSSTRTPEEVRHACTNHYKFSALMSLRSCDNVQTKCTSTCSDLCTHAGPSLHAHAHTHAHTHTHTHTHTHIHRRIAYQESSGTFLVASSRIDTTNSDNPGRFQPSRER